jgi:hypothetical protein
VAPGAAAPYTLRTRDAADGGDRICFLVENTSGFPLHVTLIACQTSGAVAVLAQARIPAGAMRAFWQGDTLGQPFALSLRPGREVGVDRLVAIGTTHPSASLWHLETRTKFAELLEPTRGTRDLDVERGAGPPELWTSTVTAMRVER